jgi:hypothetical protein
MAFIAAQTTAQKDAHPEIPRGQAAAANFGTASITLNIKCLEISSHFMKRGHLSRAT